MLLEKFTERARRANNWTSHFPERVGDHIISDYSAQLEEDITELKNSNIEAGIIEGYKNRYENLFSSWLSAKSNCFSAFITGSAKFPVRRHEKTQRSEERHYAVFQEWRVRAKKAIIRKSQPEKTFLSEIERYKAELENLKRNHEKMKEGNARIKKAGKTGENITDYLKEEFGIQDHMIEWTLNLGFGLQNNNANIKRIEGRIIELSKKEERATTTGANEFQFEGFKVVYNHEADRVQIIHDQKPGEEVRAELKKNGFRYSPTFTAWQRNLNTNGIWAAERAMKIQLPKI